MLCLVSRERQEEWKGTGVIPSVHPGVTMAIRVHPRQISILTNSAEIHLGYLLAGSSVMTLGEVGLDLTETRVSIQSQELFV